MPLCFIDKKSITEMSVEGLCLRGNVIDMKWTTHVKSLLVFTHRDFTCLLQYMLGYCILGTLRQLMHIMTCIQPVIYLSVCMQFHNSELTKYEQCQSG